jgi:hypothetical protein
LAFGEEVVGEEVVEEEIIGEKITEEKITEEEIIRWRSKPSPVPAPVRDRTSKPWP